MNHNANSMLSDDSILFLVNKKYRMKDIMELFNDILINWYHECESLNSKAKINERYISTVQFFLVLYRN